MAIRNKKLLADDSILMLSDEQSNSDEEEKLIMDGESGPTSTNAERPGTAQLLASVVPMDFRDISSEALFGKRREVYRLEA